MISASTLYHVVEAMAPLYMAMGLGYASFRFRTFTAEQCAGINHFVAVFAMPFLIFHLISSNNPYAMDLRFIAADTLQKLAILAALAAWAVWTSRRRRASAAATEGALAWVITLFSLGTLPNTIIMGVPILSGMYGADVAEGLMVQIVVLQFGLWYTVVLFLLEYMTAKQGTLTAAAADVEQQNRNISSEIVPTADGDHAAIDDDIERATGADQTAPSHVWSPSPPAAMAVAAPPARVIWKMATKKILRIPSTYASILGLVWSFIAYRFGFQMPAIVGNPVTIISQTAVGLGMFSVGTFMARRKKFIACSYPLAAVAMVMRFLVGPAVMAVSSLAIGLHGTLLHIGIVQAALPLAVVSFVYAEEYHLHPDIMSTGVTVGIFLSVPITILYYVLLEL